MTKITLSRCLLIVSILITILSLESSSNNLCASYKQHGFPNKESCLNKIRALREMSIVIDDKAINFFSAAKRVVKNSVSTVADAATSIIADIVFESQGINTLSLPKSAKKKLSISALHHEPGFSLTKEEMVKFKIWEKGIIPFFIDEHSFDKVLRDRIRVILDEVNASTGVQFMEIPSPPTDETQKYVIFINRRGALRCVDHVTDNFTNEGVQRVVLGYDCIDLRAGMAGLILSLLGVPPQHNAPNRDAHIEIMNNNILPDKISLFNKLQDTDWLFHDLEYDFESASHYPFHMYSAYGGSTIRPKWHVDGSGPVGESKGLSISDILKVKMLYSYISKHSNNSMHATCSHMFQPGNAFSKYQLHKDDSKPREKPPKYLNLNPSKQSENSDSNEINTLYEQPVVGGGYVQAESANKIERPNSTEQDEDTYDSKNANIDSKDFDENVDIYSKKLKERSQQRKGKSKGRVKLREKSVNRKNLKNMHENTSDMIQKYRSKLSNKKMFTN